MAEFIDVGGGLVKSPDGRVVFAAALDPNLDKIVQAPAPVAAAPVAPIQAVGSVGQTPAQMAAAPSPAAQNVLAKLNDPAIAAVRGPSMATTTQTTVNTQQGIAPSVLDPMLQRNTDSANRQATTVETAGNDRAQRGEQVAMNQTANAYGGYVTAEQDRVDHTRRAEIARANELAFSLQEDPKVDPGHFINSLSTGQSIATVLLASLNGAFKGMVGQQGNDVLTILDKKIDQDIMAQKEQIASGRIRRGNLIQYFRDQGLRDEDAAKAAKATTWTMLDRMAEGETNRIKAGDHRTDAQLVGSQIRENATRHNDELKLSLGTDRTSTSSTSVTAPVKGSSPEERAESLGKILGARKSLEEAGATDDQLKQFDSQFGLDTPEGQSAYRLKQGELNEAQGKAQAAAEAINSLGTTAGLKRDLKSGRWVAGSDALRDGAIWDTDSGYKSVFDAAVEAYGRMQSGGVIGAEEREAFVDMLSAKRAAVLANKLNAAETTIRSRQQNAARANGSGNPAPGTWK